VPARRRRPHAWRHRRSAPPVVIKTLISDEVVDPEGNQTTILHVEKLATNESAARNIAQYALEFSESMETAEILEAFTRKADVKILEVDRAQIFRQAPPGSPQVPKFTDRKQKVVVFPNVTAGDMVVYTIKRTGKPSFPGQFFSGVFFSAISRLRMRGSASRYPKHWPRMSRCRVSTTRSPRASRPLRTVFSRRLLIWTIAPQGRRRLRRLMQSFVDQTRSRGRLLRTNPRIRRLIPSNATEAGSGISETSEINATVSTTVLPSASVHVTLPAS
jgi:hypothetical protein